MQSDLGLQKSVGQHEDRPLSMLVMKTLIRLHLGSLTTVGCPYSINTIDYLNENSSDQTKHGQAGQGLHCLHIFAQNGIYDHKVTKHRFSTAN